MPKTLRLILGDQLNHKHSWFSSPDDSVTYVLMEMRQETDYVLHHIQKVVAFFAAMREFAAWLEERGHRVVYYKLDDAENQQDLTRNLDQLIDQHGFERFEYLLPDEYRLDEQLRKYAGKLSLETAARDTEHFITQRSDLREFFGDKNYLMETFYRDIRKKHGWLMTGSGPEGGKWNYDHQNRKSLPKNVEVVTPRTFRNDVSDIVELLEKEGVKTFGSIDPEKFIWPVNREQSLTVLRFFLDECFANFGDYQDAMHTDHWSMFHSRVSFAMNSKLISPTEVVERAIAYYRENDSVELAAVEGFVRQIIGWREFMRGVYWAKMPDYETENYLNHRRHLPEFYWTGKTKMNCLHHAIDQSLEHAYAHHIQRLMITGNFALLANIDPDPVDDWYLGIYIDAIQWVELPNTRGMSQFADGGLVATKPYISSANYINKMSNYCKGCHYDHKEKTGEKACPFNSLYWNFLMRHEEKFADNGRMNMMYSLLNRKSSEEKEALIRQAESYLRRIDEL
ncbi:cryptochrome/photolyase family protein [Flavilitoribacter nigricans]|uniref:Cryptochrome/photolyase family protein n=1 Tax=Flavilitoribacter nigricans (strain ATCC 23147 / DSM 23189 / NBRC 102662 / NCIMB 1420 / SS-2) TaxID=1122177 RepID=A0A2D0NAI4_FLAN2|nr:cryptochrome/photolyase family protein [Flavilitoribacter nigricans]PHN05380.1 cryptochrome/photolyase family protein [Flavilitoribacter nigricans DSM 23189 = NBRC 102662]